MDKTVRIPDSLSISHAVQKKLFTLGYEWVDSKKQLQNYQSFTLAIDLDSGNISYYCGNGYEEISICDVFELEPFKKELPVLILDNIEYSESTIRSIIKKATEIENNT